MKYQVKITFTAEYDTDDVENLNYPIDNLSGKRDEQIITEMINFDMKNDPELFAGQLLMADAPKPDIQVLPE